MADVEVTGAEWEAVKAEAAQRSAELTALLAMDDAELVRQGYHPVSVVRGYAEDDASTALIFTVLPALAEKCGPPVFMRAGGDYTTYLFRGPGAEASARRFAGEATLKGAEWWHVTLTARPQYG
jgi:hypothetical protein